MSLGLLLIPALGGYWFLTNWNYTRFQAARSSGYHVFFRSGFFGAVLFVVAQGIISLLNHFCPRTQELWESLFSAPYSDAVALSVVLGFALPYLLNVIFDQEDGARRAAEEYGEGIELLIYESILEESTVEVSLKTGKSYIGIATEVPIALQGEADVSLIPLASGHRDKETQELRITTYYAPVVLQAMLEKSDLVMEDFRIVIATSEIVSARLFDLKIHEKFQAQNNEDPVEVTEEDD